MESTRYKYRRKKSFKYKFCWYGNQIRFVDTIKYFQQSLGSLVNSLTCKEKNVISREWENVLRNDPKLSERFLLLMEEEKKWVLNYFSSGKGTIPNELITEFDS